MAIFHDEPGKHLAKNRVGILHPDCSYDGLKVTGMRSRKVLMRAEFMLMMSLHCMSAMLWMTLMLA